MATTHNWPLHQLDIKNPPRFVVHGESDKKNTSDHFVFYRRSDNGIVLLVVYVDDIVITENNASGISSLKTFLQEKLEAKPSGTPMMGRVDCHFIREKIQDGLVSTGYVKTGEQLGDILTKAVNGARISYLCNKLDMIDIFAPI
ncbi:gag-pol polyprotein [Cucumis melo var. makuwa]|uniref:Gag-pol polyprotein n=1 Tax=Cucumis melo var. makuwa TaxID=1194695 RepID=A0A5D3C012_CUCMM|nr:gag-pol polyprotein [Cucumis melo var. makuwa]